MCALRTRSSIVGLFFLKFDGLSRLIISEVSPEILKLNELRENPTETNSKWPHIFGEEHHKHFLWNIAAKANEFYSRPSGNIIFLRGITYAIILNLIRCNWSAILIVGVTLVLPNGIIRISSSNTFPTVCQSRSMHTETLRGNIKMSNLRMCIMASLIAGSQIVVTISWKFLKKTRASSTDRIEKPFWEIWLNFCLRLVCCRKTCI